MQYHIVILIRRQNWSLNWWTWGASGVKERSGSSALTMSLQVHIFNSMSNMPCNSHHTYFLWNLPFVICHFLQSSSSSPWATSTRCYMRTTPRTEWERARSSSTRSSTQSSSRKPPSSSSSTRSTSSGRSWGATYWPTTSPTMGDQMTLSQHCKNMSTPTFFTYFSWTFQFQRVYKEAISEEEQKSNPRPLRFCDDGDGHGPGEKHLWCDPGHHPQPDAWKPRIWVTPS